MAGELVLAAAGVKPVRRRSDPIPMEPPRASDLESQLRRLRWRRASLGVVFLSLPPALLAYFHAPWSSSARTSLLLAWVAVYSFNTILLAWSRCPRCSALYFLAKPYFRLNPLRHSCGHCGCSLSDRGV